MMNWITNNVGNIFVLTILLFIVTMIIHQLQKDRQAGKSSCGNNCAHCALGGACHKISKPLGSRA